MHAVEAGGLEGSPAPPSMHVGPRAVAPARPRQHSHRAGSEAPRPCWAMQGEVIVGTFQPVNRRDRMLPTELPQQPIEGPAAAEGAATAAAAQLSAAEAGTAEQQGQQAVGRVHKPKVATWGVFPRPQNISEAYGGEGRGFPSLLVWTLARAGGVSLA